MSDRNAPLFVNGRIEWVSEGDHSVDDLDMDRCAICGKSLDTDTWWNEWQDFKDYVWDEYEENAPSIPLNVCCSCAINLYENSDEHEYINYDGWVRGW
jgi:hypothetical protein